MIPGEPGVSRGYCHAGAGRQGFLCPRSNSRHGPTLRQTDKRSSVARLTKGDGIEFGVPRPKHLHSSFRSHKSDTDLPVPAPRNFLRQIPGLEAAARLPAPCKRAEHADAVPGSGAASSTPRRAGGGADHGLIETAAEPGRAPEGRVNVFPCAVETKGQTGARVGRISPKAIPLNGRFTIRTPSPARGRRTRPVRSFL